MSFDQESFGPSGVAAASGMTAPIFDYLRRYRFKKVQLVNDTATGLRGVIVIHSTALGPAVGGLRMWTYPSEEAAIFDALRLARGMTYKYAAAGCDLGGGKAVIIGDPRTGKTEALLRAMGRMIDQLGGEYITGEDVGTTLEDMEVVHSETDHVVTLPEHAGGAGDISPATARGTILAMRACAQRVWGSPELDGRTVVLQGLGVVGSQAVRMLVQEQGAKVTVSDIDDEKVAKAVDELGVASVAPDEIYGVDAEIFAPYALGAVINDETVPRLKAKIVAGAANNILAEERHGPALQERGIVTPSTTSRTPEARSSTPIGSARAASSASGPWPMSSGSSSGRSRSSRSPTARASATRRRPTAWPSDVSRRSPGCACSTARTRRITSATGKADQTAVCRQPRDVSIRQL